MIMTPASQEKKSKVAEVDENISKIYDFKKRLGKGAYGIVWKALDKRTNQTVAVKKIFDAFRDETDAQRTFREIVFLKAFRSHENVVSILNVYKATNNLDIYLVFEYMESDLHNIIKKGTILKDVHKRYVMYQLINAVRFIHSGNVIHRDLKPSNVLIDNKCRCKLADFGLARSVATQTHNSNSDVSNNLSAGILLTDYVATRWYRAPEILVASKRYTKGIDMWSLGCILGEMLRGKPLFQGSSTINQIEKIVTALPNITEEEINAIGGGFGTALLNKQISAEKGPTLDELLKDSPKDAFNLVKSLLFLDPLARLTANDAITHNYVQKFRNTSDEIHLNIDILPPFSDDVRLTVQEYREKVYEMSHISPHRNVASRLHGKTSHTSKSKESSKLSNGSLNGKTDVSPPRPGSNGKTNSISPNDTNKMTQAKASVSVNQRMQPKLNNKLNASFQEKITVRDNSLNRTTNPDNEISNNVAAKALIKKPKTTPPSNARITTTNYFNKSTKNNSVHALNGAGNVKYQLNTISSKTINKNLDIYVDPMKVESRGSLDGGYGSLSSESNGKKMPTPKDSVFNNSNDNNTYLLTTTNSSNMSYQRTETMPSQFAPAHATQQQMHNHLDGHRSVPSVSSATFHKTSQLRNTKSEQLPTMANKKLNASICYEKRLKKLEGEIEKYKMDVNSFCKQTNRTNANADVHGMTVGNHFLHQKQGKQSTHSSIVTKTTKLPTVAVTTEAPSSQINSNMLTGAYNTQSSNNQNNYQTYEYKRDVKSSSHQSSKNGSGDYITRSYNYIPINNSVKPMQKQNYHHESNNNYTKFRYQYQQAVRPVSVSKLI